MCGHMEVCGWHGCTVPWVCVSLCALQGVGAQDGCSQLREALCSVPAGVSGCVSLSMYVEAWGCASGCLGQT